MDQESLIGNRSRTEALYRELFASSPDGKLLIDAETQRLIEFNDAACRQLGYTREEFAGHCASALDVSAALGMARGRLRDASPDAQDEFDTECRTKAGEIRHMHVWTKTFAPDGRAIQYAILRDMTERRDAEREITESAVKFRTLFETAHDAILVMDADRFLDCNMQAAVLFGCRRADLVGHSPVEFSPMMQPGDQLSSEQAAARINAALSGVPQSFTWRHLRADGTPFDAEVSLNRVDISGQLILQAIVRDISERKRVEAVLRERARDFSEAQRVAHIGSWSYDLTGALTWSEETYRLYGVSPESFTLNVGSFIELIHSEDRPAMQAWIAKCATGEPAPELEFRVILPDDTVRHISGRGELVRDAEGRPTHMAGTAQDVTDRAQADEARRLQSAALHAAANAIVITGRNGVIEWVNPAFTRLTGYSAEEAIGKNPRDLVKSGKHAPEFYRGLWETILAGDTWHGEMINRRKDGRLYSEEMVVTPIMDRSGAITHFVAIKTDITERRQLEAQLRQSQRMEVVGQLASGIAHDFNNLLTVINGTGEMVLAEFSEGSPLRADVQEIVNAGARAATLTRQLLAFSRQQILEPQVLSLNTVVAGMEKLLQRLLGEDVDLVTVLAPALGSVLADPGQIEQVITNLAVNSRDAMPHGGKLTIETQNVTIDEEFALRHGAAVSAGPYVRLVVSDTGVGMDQETSARVFEPFFTTKGPGRGTGLGLSTVFGIVKQSQGFVWVYSEVGQGTTFKIYLPQVAATPCAAGAETAVVSVSGSETILLVEDNAALRTLATRLLEPAGYAVLGAATGEEALRLLNDQQDPVHLLLSDVVMPGMSGRHLAELLAPTHPLMKVLYMSGYTGDTVVRHGVLEAKVPFLNKPFTREALLRKVREVLDT